MAKKVRWGAKIAQAGWQLTQQHQSHSCFCMLKLKVECSGKRLMVCWKIWGFWNSFSYKIVLKTCKISWGNPYSWATVWGASWNLKRVFYTILYKNEFQNPQIFQHTISLFPEHSTLEVEHGSSSVFATILYSIVVAWCLDSWKTIASVHWPRWKLLELRATLTPHPTWNSARHHQPNFSGKTITNPVHH
jgi:hypothetical protein